MNKDIIQCYEGKIIKSQHTSFQKHTNGLTFILKGSNQPTSE